MDHWDIMAKVLIGIGLVALAAGLMMLFFGKIFPFGRLPGDIYYQKGKVTFYFPLVSGLILSIILTIIFNLFLRR